jgi:hypothetical protein
MIQSIALIAVSTASEQKLDAIYVAPFGPSPSMVEPISRGLAA